MRDDAFVAMLLGFVGELRTEGVTAGTGEALTYSRAMADLDPTDLLDLYWAGRATLITRRDQIATYDRVFRRYFLDEADSLPEPWRSDPARAETLSVLHVPATEPRDGEQVDDEPVELGWMASNAEIWRNKSFAACTRDELTALRRIMSRIKLAPPRRCTRRMVRAVSERRRPDLRRTVRETMRMHGEPSQLYWRRRRLRPRPLVLILDVSGSMSDYSRALLQFAYSARRATSRVEVFCFGTRLTRITRALERRRPDDALADAAATVFDWEGGTRIGDSLDAFVRTWGRRGISRGAIVVICSDGLDRGEPAALSDAMQRLARLSHSVVWMNPHKGDRADFRPNTLGMMVAEPHIDLILSGHDLRSLEQFAASLPALR